MLCYLSLRCSYLFGVLRFLVNHDICGLFLMSATELKTLVLSVFDLLQELDFLLLNQRGKLAHKIHAIVSGFVQVDISNRKYEIPSWH